MITLTTIPPQIGAKRVPCQALPALGCKFRSNSMPSMPAAAWRRGCGTSSRGQRTSPKRGRIPILSLTTIVEDQRVCYRSTVLPTLRLGLSSGIVLAGQMVGPTRIPTHYLIHLMWSHLTQWMHSSPYLSSDPPIYLMAYCRGNSVCVYLASS